LEGPGLGRGDQFRDLGWCLPPTLLKALDRTDEHELLVGPRIVGARGLNPVVDDPIQCIVQRSAAVSAACPD
jgi:hypothetical protein